MSRWFFIWREFGRNVARNPGTAFSAVLSLTLLFVLFNMFWVAARSTDELYQSLVSDMQMEIFIPDSVDDSMVAQLSLRVQGVPGVQAVSYITREAARDQLTGLLGLDLLAADTLNPLPRSFVLTFALEYLTSEQLTSIERQLAEVTGSTQIQYGKKWLESTEQTRGVIRRVGVLIGGLILLATVISSANNIRLMSRARVTGLTQMQLLGAGRWLIAAPFVLEGGLAGAVASGIAWGVVFYGKAQLKFLDIGISMPPTGEIIIFCVLTTMLGAISGYFGVRKLLD
jgi:cell division transport system permease protein